VPCWEIRGILFTVLNLPALTYDYISPAVEDLLGFTVEECIDGGVGFMTSRIHPEDCERQRAMLAELVERGANEDFQQVEEYRFQHKSRGIPLDQ
jgi:PAS domain-containing protein